jgi:peptidoglycan/xylan/chitin deacetylase (PgdA/CDA1 family)
VLSRDTGQGHQCLFTFDDGGVSALTEIADRLQTLGWRGHFFITTDRIGQPGFLSADQIRELHRRGHVIGSHSRSHPRNIDELDDAALNAEWSESSAVLADLLKTPTWCGSVPGGFFSRRVARAAQQAGLKLLFTSEPTCRWSQIGELHIAGRLAIVNHTSAELAAKLASAERLTILRQQLVWTGKKFAKAVAGGFYRQASEWFFR